MNLNLEVYVHEPVHGSMRHGVFCLVLAVCKYYPVKEAILADFIAMTFKDKNDIRIKFYYISINHSSEE